MGAKLDMGNYGASLAFLKSSSPPASRTPSRRYSRWRGEQRNRGVELNVFGEPARGVRVIGGVSVIDATLRDTKNPATEGNDAVGVPNYTAVLNTEWTRRGFPA